MCRFILFLLLVSSVIVLESNIIDLKIEKVDSFPYPTNKSFSISIVRRGNTGAISNSLSDTLVILIRNDDDVELIRAIIDYGFKDTIDQAYKSDYMTIPTWTKMEDSTALNISILFSRKAYNKWLELYQLPAKSNLERRRMLSTLRNTRRLLRERLNLFVPPNIKLSVFSPDERMNELMPGELGTAICHATDGIPLSVPIFSNINEFDVKTESLDESRNERTVKFLVSLADHERRLRCMAGSSEASSVIFVMHHPTAVSLQPEPGLMVENGSTIACVKANGYPPPVLLWTLVSGPKNASGFHTIVEAGTKFHLSKEAPLHSRWSINCSATNIIRKSIVVYNRTVSFTVGRSQEGLIVTLNLTTQIIIGITVVAAIILFSIMIVVIVCVIRRCCVSREQLSASRKNGISSKSLSKEKGAEPDHVIPLLPDAPPAYTQSMANQSLPTQQYKVLYPDEYVEPSTRIVSPDKAESSVHDPGLIPGISGEVTYAEINTSDLPMRSDPPTPPSNPDQDQDQVIYSQIVGTLSNSTFSTQHSSSDNPNNV